MLEPKEKIEELKKNYKRFTGLELTDEDILYNAKLIRADKATKFLSDNMPLYTQVVDVIAHLEKKVEKPVKTKKAKAAKVEQ